MLFVLATKAKRKNGGTHKIRSKKISIICVGEDYRDPAAKKAILSAIRKFRERNIPVVFCSEKPPETTLLTQCKYLNELIEILEKAIKANHLESFFTKSILKKFYNNMEQQNLHLYILSLMLKVSFLTKYLIKWFHPTFIKMIASSLTLYHYLLRLFMVGQ